MSWPSNNTSSTLLSRVTVRDLAGFPWKFSSKAKRWLAEGLMLREILGL